MGGRNTVIPIPVQPEEIDAWAEPLAWHFKSFCRGGQWKPAGLLDDCRQKRRQLWVAYDEGVKAAVLTQVADDIPQSFIVTHAAGCDRKEWLHLFDYLTDWAREIGCQRVEIVARNGWAREMKALGLRQTHVIMEKRL